MLGPLLPAAPDLCGCEWDSGTCLPAPLDLLDPVFVDVPLAHITVTRTKQMFIKH